MLVTEKSNFNRGDKASVSVRLRSKKTVAESSGVKKRNRHSGDFSFFKHQNSNNAHNSNNHEDETDKKDGGDWAYITFQNGVPTVQDIKTNVGPVSAKEPVGVIVNAANPVARPVKMTNHMPALWQPQNQQNKRVSGDFSMFAPPSYQPPPIARQATPAAMSMKQQQQPIKRSPKKTSPSPTTNGNVTKVNVQQARPNVIYRRKNESNSNGGVALHGGAAKRCSGEFDFGRNANRRSSSDYSLFLQATPEHTPVTQSATPPSVVRVQVNYQNQVKSRPKSVVYPNGGQNNRSSPDVVRGTPVKGSDPGATQRGPRPLGLGRRAVTQINIKKNSYNSAMCKSQENLVKVSLNFI